MKNYSLEYCTNLIDKYVNLYGGTSDVINEGVLGLGLIVLHSADGKKSIIIREVFLTAWSSGHTIRMYNKLPKKYKKLILEIN